MLILAILAFGMLVGWLAWALYYPMLTGWRRSRREVAVQPSDG